VSTTALWIGPADEVQTLTPNRAEACRQVAAAAGYPHSCPWCAAEPVQGAVAGFRSIEALRRHSLDVHGEIL